MKNKKTNILIIIMLVLLLAMVGLVYLSIYEGFAFTSKQAAGEFGDDYCIETKDFDVYYYNIRVDAEPAICGFNIVEKLVVGYKAVYDKEYRKVYMDDEYLGILYSIKGNSGYCNILVFNYAGTTQIPEELLLVNTVIIDGQDVEVKVNSLFETEEVPSEFVINGHKITVDKEVCND